MPMQFRMTRSTGNVFREVGFSAAEAEHLRVRAELMVALQKTISNRALKRAKAARLLRVTEPRVSDLMRGRIDLFGADTLIDMLTCLGAGITVTVRQSRRPIRVA